MRQSIVYNGLVFTTLVSGTRELGLELSTTQLGQFESYFHELETWNQKTNLTAITDYEGVQTKHFLDSLTIAPALPCPTPPGLKMLDLGTGAGFPGLPLKILYPEIKLTLLEATGKKVTFLRHIISTLELAGVTVIAGRAEETAQVPEYRERFDIVVSRAVAELPALLELALPFCSLGGRVIAQKKGDIKAEVGTATRALSVLGGEITEVREIPLSALPDQRCLVIIAKITPTPAFYPRRPGMPAKKPLV